MDPLISIAMGSYNCTDENQLIACINSIIEQTYSNWEFVICNDGSCEKSANMLRRISKMDSRIVLLEYPNNMGLAYALNYCIEHSRGSFIARQDDDDASLPERLATQLEYLIHNPEVSFVGSNSFLKDKSSGSLKESALKETPQKSDYLWNSPYIHPTLMFRRESLEAVGGYRTSRFVERVEDYDLFMRLTSAGKIGANVQDNLFVYTLPDRKTNTRSMRDRINEMIIRCQGFKKLRLYPKAALFVFKPIVMGLVEPIYKRIS